MDWFHVAILNNESIYLVCRRWRIWPGNFPASQHEHCSGRLVCRAPRCRWFWHSPLRNTQHNISQLHSGPEKKRVFIYLTATLANINRFSSFYKVIIRNEFCMQLRHNYHIILNIFDQQLMHWCIITSCVSTLVLVKMSTLQCAFETDAQLMLVCVVSSFCVCLFVYSYGLCAWFK